MKGLAYTSTLVFGLLFLVPTLTTNIHAGTFTCSLSEGRCALTQVNNCRDSFSLLQQSCNGFFVEECQTPAIINCVDGSLSCSGNDCTDPNDFCGEDLEACCPGSIPCHIPGQVCTKSPPFICVDTPDHVCNAPNPGSLGQKCCAGTCTSPLKCDEYLSICLPDPNAAQVVPSIRGSCGSESLDTAIGCINIGSAEKLADDFTNWVIGFAGGLGFLMIVWGGYLFMASRGDPSRVQKGKDIITSALSGIFLLIFSAFIVELVGVEILNIFQ